MNLNIQRGRVQRPQRVVIYAPEGLGKSTLASQLESPLFLDFEKGTHHLDVARLEPMTLVETLDILTALAKDQQGFKTLVVDTIDWLEELVIQDVCKTAKKTGIEDFGYGKGYVVLAERFNQLLATLDKVAETMHVVCLAHSHVKRLELPETPAFDHYELKLSKQVSPLVREWCDALLFGNWKHVIKTGDDDRTKATKGSGKERIIRATNSSVADAKNRHGLGEEEPWSLDTLQKILAPVGGGKPKTSVVPSSGGAAPSATKEAAKDNDSIPGVAPENGGPAAETPLPAEVWAICVKHGDAVTKFLRGRAEISGEQDWKSMSDAYAQRIAKNPVAFLKACGVEVAA